VPRQRRRSPGRPGSVLRLWPAIPVLWLVLVLGVVAPASAGPEPLPPCRYDDVPAAATDYADWQSTLVDTIFMVPSSYAPPDLAPVSQAGLSGGDSVRALLMDDLTRLAADAKARRRRAAGVLMRVDLHHQHIAERRQSLDVERLGTGVVRNRESNVVDHAASAAFDPLIVHDAKEKL